ncbi:MAG: PH domain-containing protein [Anaerotignaceae bacterium]
MSKTLKPHYLLILISTLKMLTTLLVFFGVAVSLSPNKYYSAINLAKILIPIAVIIYAYMFYFWHSVTINVTAERLDFNMTAGRKNHIVVIYSDVETVTLKQGIFEKLFGISRIAIKIKNVEKTYGGQIMVLYQYMVFKTAEAEEIKDVITKSMNIPLKSIPKY